MINRINIDFFNVPIFVISFNRFSSLKKCVERYKKDGYKNINIIDNCSDDSDLLEYLAKVDCKVYHMNKNWGHMVFWECGLFDEIINSSYYIVTDPDVLPVADCPSDYVEHFYNVIQKYDVNKVGFALDLTDLPVENRNRMDIVRFESFYYDNVISLNPLLYDAMIDTTFALYKPGIMNDFYRGIRTGKPYIAKHLGWYFDSEDLSDEQKSYLNKDGGFGNSFLKQEVIDNNNLLIASRLYNRNEIVDKYKRKIYSEFSVDFSKIYVYGAGEIGKKVIRILEECNIQITGVVVTEKRQNNEVVFNKYKLLDIKELSCIYDEQVGIILAVSVKNQMEILPELYRKKIKNICSIEL